MAYEQFMDNHEGVEVKRFDKKKMIIMIVLIVIGAFLFSFKYIAWTFPTNSVIHDSVVYHDYRFIESVWENEDNIVVVFRDWRFIDVYDKVLETKVYQADFQSIMTIDVDIEYDVLIAAAGYNQVHIGFYRILGLIQVLGVGLAIFSVLWYVFRFNHYTNDQFQANTAISRTKSELNDIRLKSQLVNPGRSQKPPV